MKAEGIEYDERMELLEEVTYPQPLGEPLLRGAAASTARPTRGCASPTSRPKSVVRDMYEQGRTFTEFVAHYGLARSEGLVLRYLSDAYRALRQTVPEQVKTDELDEIVEWLGETVRQTDSSLLDEWEALTDPESVDRAAAAAAAGEPPPPPRPITGNERAFTVMVRNAMFQKVQLAARDRFDELGAARRRRGRAHRPAGRPAMTAAAWEEALGAYWDEHESIGTGPQARSPQLLMIDREPRRAAHLDGPPDRRRPRGPPRLRDRRDGRPRRLGRRRRAGDPHRVVRAGRHPAGGCPMTAGRSVHRPPPSVTRRRRHRCPAGRSTSSRDRPGPRGSRTSRSCRSRCANRRRARSSCATRGCPSIRRCGCDLVRAAPLATCPGSRSAPRSAASPSVRSWRPTPTASGPGTSYDTAVAGVSSPWSKPVVPPPARPRRWRRHGSTRP